LYKTNSSHAIFLITCRRLLQCRPNNCSVYLPLAAHHQDWRSFLHLSSDHRLHK